MNYFKTIIAVLFLLLSGNTPAQFKFEKAIQVTKENGLPVSGVRTMRKDEEGFMWIASSEGLCRFDGQIAKLFTEGKDLKYSLFDNSVNVVLPDKNFIWAGTNQGISVLDKRDYSFRHYQFGDSFEKPELKRRFDQAVSVLFRDRAGNIWVGTKEKGVYRYEKTADHFKRYSIPRDKYPPLIPALASDNSILGIAESRTNDSIIWAGSTAGLWEINKYSGEVKVYTYPQKDKDYQVALNAFRRLYHHDDGLLYVGNWAAGINVFNPVTKTYTPLDAKNDITNKIAKGNIGNIVRKSDHELWISTSKGIAIYDTKLKEVTWHKFNNVPENEYYAIDFIDESSRIWFADYFGLRYFDPAVQQFAQYSYKHLSNPGWAYTYYILPDKSGNNITVCPRFTDGLFHFNRQENSWKKILFPGGKTFQTDREVVRGFVQLQSGEYIISSDQGLFLYSEKKRSMIPLQGIPGFSPSRRGDIILDRSGNLWVSDDTTGLIKWNPQSGKYKVYRDGLSPVDTSATSGRLISGHFGRMSNFFEDSHGNIWFQRANGLGVYSKERDSILNFLYTQNEKNSFPLIFSFAEDRNGKVWISGIDSWLGYALTAQPQNGIVYKLNLREKSGQGNLQWLDTDKNGDVWGITNKEMVKINAADLSLSSYSFQYGVNAADFYNFSFLPTGEMIFGGRNDIVIANPSEFKRNTEIPVPYITEVLVLNRPFNFNLNESPFRLKYKQNFFTIGFSAKAYTMAKDVRFRYRLSGFDDWTEITGHRFANYTNVPGGDYVFQLQAANNEGIWNEKILELPIYVATPFWQTWWFRTAAILLLAGIIYTILRYRVNQFRKKEKLKSEYEKKLANVEMSSLLAQMNPHFLFNSLNSIDSYIIKNESRKASEYLNNFARLIRLILQNSRSNYITLKDELEALDLYMQMEGLRFNNKFEYEIKVDEGIDTSVISIPPMLIQPYVENAIWHGLMHKSNGETGKVEILLSTFDQKLKCVVQDNGIGRGKAEELKAQKSSTRKRSMGMQITRDRIEMINKLYGTDTRVKIIDLVNKNGDSAGTKVELIIPI